MASPNRRSPSSVGSRRQKQSIQWDGTDFEALILEGGGTKGMVYAGATQRLDEAGLLSGVKCFAGTSAGAQTAMLLAVGYSGNELAVIMRNAPWSALLDSSSCCGCCGCFGNMHRLWTAYGVCEGEVLLRYLDGLIAEKLGRRGVTLKELYDMKGVVLRLGACDVTTRRFQFLDYNSFPDMPIAKAARSSSSIPFVFVPVKHVVEDHQHIFVDGGLEGNLPTSAFPGKRTLAFDLMSTQDFEQQNHRFISIQGFLHFAGIIVDMVMNAAQAEGGFDEEDASADMHRSKGIDIIRIDCKSAGMLDTKMSDDAVKKLVAAGYDAVSSFLLDSTVSTLSRTDAVR